MNNPDVIIPVLATFSVTLLVSFGIWLTIAFADLATIKREAGRINAELDTLELFDRRKEIEDLRARYRELDEAINAANRELNNEDS